MANTDQTMKIIITGSRTWREQGTVQKAIVAAVRQHFFGYNEVSKSELEAVFPNVTIVHGGATGADTIAGDFAKENGMKTEVFYPDWEKEGKRAGPIRNQKMIKSSPRADMCLGFVADANSKGTIGTISMAKRSGIPVMEIPPLVSVSA